MNIELLKEINKLVDKGVSHSDISSTLAIPKTSILLMLRIESIVSEKFISEKKILENENRVLQEKFDNLDKLFSFTKALKLEALQKTNSSLQEENDELCFQNDEYREELVSSLSKLGSIPDFIVGFFCRKL